jgi:ectoine hydroxylase-related dioxygenase (phytanoyl-CoA dioxygenase family)
MVGFILMIDDFTPENGATCFMLGSQAWKRHLRHPAECRLAGHPAQ